MTAIINNSQEFSVFSEASAVKCSQHRKLFLMQFLQEKEAVKPAILR